MSPWHKCRQIAGPLVAVLMPVSLTVSLTGSLTGSLLALMPVLMLVPGHQSALACDSDTACRIGAVDRFFLPLIAASLMKDGLVGSSQPSPDALPVTPSALKPVIIKPPSQPPSRRRPSLVPVVKLLHQLETGDLVEGGTSRLIVGPTRSSARPADIIWESDRHEGVRLPPLGQLAPGSAIWQMEHLAILPAVPLWPLDGLAMPVSMRLACGACGAKGAMNHFSGTAQLEMLFDGLVIGWIDDIDLVASDGMTATGYLSFSDARSGQHVVEDRFARMFLKIGEDETNFQGSLATWMTDRKLVDGALSMVPVDRLNGIGAIAGHFSGAPCTADCGVEN